MEKNNSIVEQKKNFANTSDGHITKHWTSVNP